MTAFGIKLDTRTTVSVGAVLGVAITLLTWSMGRWVDFVETQAKAVPPLQAEVKAHNEWAAKEQPILKAATEKVGADMKAAIADQKKDIELRFEQNEKFNNRLWDIQISTNNEIKQTVTRMEAAHGAKLDRLLELLTAKPGDKHAERLRPEGSDTRARGVDQGPHHWHQRGCCVQLQPPNYRAGWEQDAGTLPHDLFEFLACQGQLAY